MVQSFSNFLNSMGSSLGSLISKMPNKVRNVKVPTSVNQAVQIKGIKTERHLKEDYVDRLNYLITKLLDTESANKIKRYTDQDRLMKNSLAPVLIKLTVDQCFATEQPNEFINVEILEDDNTIREALEEIPANLIKRTKLKKLLKHNLIPFLTYGELFLRKIRDKHGFVIGFDVLEGKYIYPICDNGEILFYLDLTPKEDGYADMIEPKEIVAFLYRPQAKKIIDSESLIEDFAKDLPDEIKAILPDSYMSGEPLLYDARKALKKLAMLEILSDMNTFKSLNTPTLVTVNVEKIKDEEQITELADTYEEFFTDTASMIDMSTLENMDGEDLDYSKFSNSGVKVIPVEGSGKNGMTVLDLFTQQNNIDEQVDKNKKDALQLAGFPQSVLEASTSTEIKNDLQVNKRFRNTCMWVQNAIAEPLGELFLEDALNYKLKSYVFTEDSFNVTFKNIIGLDGIEDLEIQIATISQVSGIFDTMKRVADSSEHIEIDEAGTLAYIEDNIKNFKSACNLLKYVENTKEEEEVDAFSDDMSTGDFEEDNDIEERVSDETFEELNEPVETVQETEQPVEEPISETPEIAPEE